MHQFTFPTMTALHQHICEDMLYSHQGHYDWITNTDVIKEHIWAQADRMDWECDISRFWLPPSRWTMMIRQYLDPEAVEAWLKQIKARAKKGSANRMVLRTRTVASRRGGNATTRALGSCMLSISLSLEPTPTILLHSRTGYMGYLSPLDWSVAYHTGRLAADTLGIDISSFRFVWFAETVQYHRFRTIAFPLGDSQEMSRFKDIVKDRVSAKELAKYPAIERNWEMYKKWRAADREGLSYYQMSSYNSQQRPRKRFHTQMLGYDVAKQFEDENGKAFRLLTPLDVKDLTLSKIGLE